MMYSRNSFGSYYPISSTIHSLNPAIKLFNFIIAIVLLFLSNSIYINAFLLALVFIMVLMSYVPFRFYFNSIWSFRLLYILCGVLCYYFDVSLELCLVYMIKFTIVVEYLNLLAYTTSPSESIYGIEKFLSLFNFLYLPLSRFAFLINSLLRYLPLYLSVEYKTYKASSSRGIDYYHSGLFGRIYSNLHVRSKVRRLTKLKNKEIQECSHLRLFDIKKYRTNYRTNKVCFIDIFFMLFHLCLIAVYLVDRGVL